MYKLVCKLINAIGVAISVALDFEQKIAELPDYKTANTTMPASKTKRMSVKIKPRRKTAYHLN